MIKSSCSLLAFFFVCFSYLQTGLAYPNGPGTCTAAASNVLSMPGSSNTAAGYALMSTTSNSYTGGGTVSLVVTGTNPSFTGLLLYAVDQTGTKVGSWVVPDSNYQLGSPNACSGDSTTLTHANPNTKGTVLNGVAQTNSAVYTYKGPTAGTGSITFKAVIMTASYAFQVLDPLTFTEAVPSTASPTTATPTTSAPTTATPTTATPTTATPTTVTPSTAAPTTASPTTVNTQAWTAQSVLRGTINAPSFSGSVTFNQASGPGSLVNIVINIANSFNGTFALHVHTWGDISSPAGTNAGSHFNPFGNNHGCFGINATRHVGDVLNAFTYTNAPNPQSLTIQRDLLDLGNTYASIIGRAVIVHAQADNCFNPTGFAGPFIAQGVIGIPSVSAGLTQLSNSFVSAPPNSAIAVMFPTFTYILSNGQGACLSGSAPWSVSASACTDRNSLVFLAGTVLTGVVSSKALPFTWSTVGPNAGFLVNSTDSTCLSTAGAFGVCSQSSLWTLTAPLASLTGTVQFSINSDSTVRVVANISGLLPNTANYNVALHVHYFGEEYNGLNSKTGSQAGSHYDPLKAGIHALPPTVPRHMGDMGFWNVDVNGNLWGDVNLNLLNLTANTGNIIGRAVVLHVWTDDGTTQPTGAAAGRVAIGVIGLSNTVLPPPAAVPTYSCPPGYPYLTSNFGYTVCFNKQSNAVAGYGPINSWCALPNATSQILGYVTSGFGLLCSNPQVKACPASFPFLCQNSFGASVCFNDPDLANNCNGPVNSWCSLPNSPSLITGFVSSGYGISCSDPSVVACPSSFPFLCTGNFNSKVCYNQASYATACNGPVGSWCGQVGSPSLITGFISQGYGGFC